MSDPVPAFDTIADELAVRLSDRAWDSWSDAELERWAARAFAHQFETCAPYRALCERRGATPDTVASWEDVPAVPATAFKYFDFVSVVDAEGRTGTGGPGAEELPSGGGAASSRDGRVFRTSGTTRGSERRGRHHVPRPDLYRASLAEPFRRSLLADLDRPVPFVSLIPSPDDTPESSLSFMVGAAAERFASEVHWLVGGDGAWLAAGSRTGEAVASDESLRRGVPAEEALAGLSELRAKGEPILLLGTALAFTHTIEGAAAVRAVADTLRDLPEGSRVMETGGFKGVRRRVSRAELYEGIEELTGIPSARIVNEYGMTELLSQLYEPVLRGGARGADTPGLDGRIHELPPWLRVRAVDPTTLRPVAEGREGILAFFDLANLGSVCQVLTEDVGAVVDGRVRLRGRATGAEPRGCSRAMDELMSATAEVRADG